MPVLIAVLVLLISVTSVTAHGNETHADSYACTFDPWVVIPLLIAISLYTAGFAKLWARAILGRRQLSQRAILYAAGILSLIAALVSPLHSMGERLFTFHMIEHEIVMAIAAPLIVLSRPVATLLWAIPRGVRHQLGNLISRKMSRRIWNFITAGTVATVVHAVAIWLWHVPALLDASVVDLTTHRVQHLSFLLTALLFWWSVIWRSQRGMAAWHIFATMVHTSLLGALIALSPRVLYPIQTQFAADWGLSPLEDQQLAGMLMWVPAGTVYAGAALALIWLWVASSSKEGIQHV
jgi:putative membrane protein